MSTERWQKIQDIFDRVADLPIEAQQSVVEECGEGDQALVADVMKLLRADASEHHLLDQGLEDTAVALLEFEPLTSLIQRKIGPYRLLQVIGEGGMGIVYLAERTDIGSLVAIKLLRDAWFSSSRRDRFTSEQRMLAQLNHPGIARIYDSGSLEDSTPWFVMEYVGGIQLTDFWATRRESLHECLRLLRHVCDAVQYAHEHAIIHRDLKPSNILVTSEGEVKLLDFGVAKQLDGEADITNRTLSALTMMTPAYCAPEQLTGEPIGVYTDVYALGVLLYQLLTGKLPFEEEQGERSAQLHRSIEDEPERPSLRARRTGNTLAKKLSKGQWADLDAICLSALQRQPMKRYRSADALGRDIDAYLEGRPLEARPNNIYYRLGKYIRRHTIALATAAAIILVAIVAGTMFSIRLARARHAELAEAARTQRIQRFMLNLFGTDGEAAPSNDLKVVTLLDHGAQEASALSADVETQAALYETLGTMYNRMGKFQKADELLSQSLVKMKQASGPDSVQVAEVLFQLGTLRGDQGKLEDAQRYVNQGLEQISRNHLSADDPVTLGGKVALGRVSLQSGAYQKTIDVLTPITHLKPPYSEEQNYIIRDSYSALGYAELELQHFDLARANMQQAITLDKQLLGPSHPQTGTDLINLASVDLSTMKLSEAEATYREGIAAMSAWYGTDNPDVATAKSMLARTLVAENTNNKEAEAILKDVLQTQEHSYGPVHERVAFTLNALGEIAVRRGDLKNAEADFFRAVTINRSLLGYKDLHTAIYEANLANVYMKQSKFVQAEQIFRRVTEVVSKLPPGNHLIATTRGRWGRSLLALHQYPEAERQLQEAYQLMKADTHPPITELHNVTEDLAKYYESTKQPAKAQSYREALASNRPQSPHLP